MTSKPPKFPGLVLKIYSNLVLKIVMNSQFMPIINNKTYIVRATNMPGSHILVKILWGTFKSLHREQYNSSSHFIHQGCS
jgi:hypothetical protein